MGLKLKSIKHALRKVQHVRKKVGLTRKRFSKLFGNGAGVSPLQSLRPTSASTERDRRLANLVRSF